MSPSYGFTYLTSYGWTGTGTGLREGAIERPLAIPQKKNLSGVGKDRDEAFPFWDHLFTAASKAITIKVSSDDEDDDDKTETPLPIPLQRTTTGILSNQRPTCGTPVSTSGSTTPSLYTDTNATNADATNLSLLATAKREAAKRGLYSRFFRGPVLGPDDDDDDDDHASSAAPHLAPSKPSSVLAPVSEHLDGRQTKIAKGTKNKRKRRSEDRAESKEERRERKRLKKERKAARAARRAEKALARVKATKEKNDRLDQKTKEPVDGETRLEENKITPQLGNARRQTRRSMVVSARNPKLGECTRKRPEEELVSANDGDDFLHRPPNVEGTNACLTTKKKKGKRKDIPSNS